MSDPSFDVVFERVLGVRARRIGGHLHLALESETLELSETGEFIYRAIDGSRTLRQVAQALSDHYEIEEDEALDDTAEFIGVLRAAGVVS